MEKLFKAQICQHHLIGISMTSVGEHQYWVSIQNQVDFYLKVTRFTGKFDIFEMEESRADKNWAHFYKIKEFNN